MAGSQNIGVHGASARGAAPRRRRAGRFALAIGTAVACLATVMGAASAGTRTPATAEVAELTSAPRSLEYSPDRVAPLRRVNQSLIAEVLGLPFGAPPPAPTSRRSGSTGGVAPTTVRREGTNLVTTPVYQCVNGRQTADPLSPPCVAQFTGDNGGATYRGVSRDEIRVLVRFPGQLLNPNDQLPRAITPYDRVQDLDQPLPGGDTYFVEKLRLYMEYFNRRFQTYGRRVHLFVYFDKAGGAVNWGRGEALDVLYQVQPFGVAEGSRAGNDGFLEVFLSRGLMGFRDRMGRDLEARYPDQVWSYEPALDVVADQYASYVCRKVVGHPVVWSGEPGQSGRERRFGVLHARAGDSTSERLFHQLYEMVLPKLRACGANIVAEAAFPVPAGCGTAVIPAVGQSPVQGGSPYAAEAVARFRLAGVTTVLWPGCADPNIGPAALAAQFRPEWVLMGEGAHDQAAVIVGDKASAHLFDHRAIVVTPATLVPELSQANCYKAQREADPSLPESYVNPVPPNLFGAGAPTPPTQAEYDKARYMCPAYENYRTLFTAIQLAGPRLTPETFARGLRGLDYFVTPDPQTPSCYYRDDNSCIQDAIAEYWDLSKVCWRAIEGGRRYLPGQWPKSNINAEVRGDEPCNDGHT